MLDTPWKLVILLAGWCPCTVEAQCYEGSNLYAFGPEAGDQQIIGDDGPPGVIDLSQTSASAKFRFYGTDYTKIYVNINGQLSFGDSNDVSDENWMEEFFPSPVAKDDPPFLTAFWNDLYLILGQGALYYRQTTDPALLQRVADDLATKNKNITPTVVVVCTWVESSSYEEVLKTVKNSSYVPLFNTFQTALVMDDSGLSYTIFNYDVISWFMSHSLAAVAMMNQGHHSSHVTNLFASGSELMLELAEICANAGLYGRFVIHTDPVRIKILDQPEPEVISRCYLKYDSLYPYGQDIGDTVISKGDDGPPGLVTFTNPVTFYGVPRRIAYININGPISFDSPYLQQWPTREPVDEVTFMAAFWNDIFLTGEPGTGIYYRLDTNPELLDQFKTEVMELGRQINPTELMIVTWSGVKAYGFTSEDPGNTFQVVFGYEGNKSYTLFIYSYIGWYQDTTGHFAVAMFNKGGSSGVSLNVGPRPGPESFTLYQQGNNVNKPGTFIYETHPPIITAEQPTCVCRINKLKWLTTFDGKRHPILHEQKTRIARYLDHDDPCKFQLTIYSTQTEGGDYKVQWVSFSFGIHVRNEEKFDKDIQFNRFGNETVYLRGHGLSRPKAIFPPWYYVTPDGMTDVCLVGDEAGGWVINSTMCPFRLQYAPRCPDPVVIFTISKAYYKSTDLVGMCQDCDGDPDNDYRPCEDDPVGEWTFWQTISDLSETCKEK